MSLVALYVFYLTTEGGDKALYDYNSRLFLCVVSAFANIFVLYYHAVTPPHPKFLMLPSRKFSIRVHIISGCMEFFAAIMAFSLAENGLADPLWGRIAAVAAFAGHVPSSYAQTPIVFGAKSVMVTGYMFAIGLHLFCALQLFIEPSSIYWLMNSFLILNIYVWCRVFYFFFQSVGLFKHSLYTASILLSGVLLFPSVLGAAGNLFFLFFVLTYLAFYRKIANPSEAEIDEAMQENARDFLVSKQIKQDWLLEKLQIAGIETNGRTDADLAKALFEHLDTDQSGYLDANEVTQILKEWKTEQSFINTFVEQHSHNGQIDFNSFYRNVWNIGNLENKFFMIDKQLAQTEEQQAKLIFNQLDTDSSGFIDSFELRKLLLEWGLPSKEVDAYLKRYDDGDSRFSFEEFYKHMKPIWRFAYSTAGERI